MECEKTEVEAPPPEGENYVLRLPRSLNLEEKKYLLAVERGDLPNVRRILQVANKHVNNKFVDVNCVDSLGRGALTLAIDSENLEMVELLVVMGVETKDALLHAIDREFVEAVELLLEHEELLRIDLLSQQRNVKEEDVRHSWEKVDPSSARHPPEMTPLVLAAQRNNYEILKLLLDRGATLPMPHDIRCGCDDCLRSATGDPLRLSSMRISEYKALASPSLIALSSSDPLKTAFDLSWELRELAISEPESRGEYLKLRRQVEKFAVDLLQQVRTTTELNTILNYDPTEQSTENPTQLARLELAIRYRQKRFIAHSHVQQLLAAIWYEGVPGFRRMSASARVWILLKTALLFPFYCVLYLVAPETKTGRLLRNPFMKFLIHASSYLFFLLVLILVSQRAEVEAVRLFGSEENRRLLEENMARQRGSGPSPLEGLVALYVVGFIWQEVREVFVDGLRAYLRDLWNFIDFTRNTLYVATAILRIAAYLQQRAEIQDNPSAALIPRENWSDFDPHLVAEGLFSAANVFSAFKLVHLFSINPHLGPLQISLGRMVIDIVKFFFIYTLVLFAFACGLNQLLWYFAELEKRKCYGDFAMPDWDPASDACLRWRRFSSLFESCQSLFWASFGGVGIDSFELTGVKSYTRFWGLLMFGSYSVINVIVLLNLLIAMMSNSYSMIEEHSDTEWKFARTKLWMSYFEEGNTVPPPFNILPSPKVFLRLCGFRKKSIESRGSARRRAREHKYGAVMRALVWRYVVSAHNQHDMEPVTEDDIHELKTELTSWRCEMVDIFRRNGMDVSGADTKEKTVLGKKMRMWERRLMKDFQVSGPMSSLAEEEAKEEMELQQPAEGEDNAARWRRVARLAVLKSAERRWGQVVSGAVQSSQIGKSNSKASLQSQRSLKRAMEEAQKLTAKSPLPPISPVQLPRTTAATILNVLQDVTVEPEDSSRSISPRPLFSPDNSSTLRVTRPKSPAAVDYVDERHRDSPKPLVSQRTSPPKVIKRKSPSSKPNSNSSNSNSSSGPTTGPNAAGTTRTRSPLTLTSCTQLMNSSSAVYNFLPVSLSPSKSSARSRNQRNSPSPPYLGTDEGIVRPKPRPAISPKKLPSVAIIPVTPILGGRREDDRQRLVKIEPKSPKVPNSKSPKRTGWL